jgi:hypothetical protein
MARASKRHSNWTKPDLRDLNQARVILENPGLTAKLTDLIGTPVERVLQFLPENWSEKIQQATRIALTAALKVAVTTLGGRRPSDPRDFGHKLAVAATGGLGGAFGLVSLPIELPVTTTIMLRSIADIARCGGEDLKSVESRLACIEVLALGGRSAEDRASGAGYFAVRTALARAVTEAAGYIAEKGVVEESAPALLRLIAAVGTRFGVVVGEKAAAIAVPIVGAASGAMINTLFMAHFQNMAHGHFTVRRLERIYGETQVKERYGCPGGERRRGQAEF